jgi:hypothetical protein
VAGHVAREARVAARLLHLVVDRYRDVGRGAVGERGPAGQVDDVLRVRGAHDALAVAADVLEKGVVVDVLEVGSW